MHLHAIHYRIEGVDLHATALPGRVVAGALYDLISDEPEPGDTRAAHRAALADRLLEVFPEPEPTPGVTVIAEATRTAFVAGDGGVGTLLVADPAHLVCLTATPC